MHTEELGNVSVKCKVDGSVINGFLIGSDQEAENSLEGLKETLKNKLENGRFTVEEFGVGDFRPVKTDSDEDQQEKPSTRELYRVAKIMIGAIREQAGRRTT